MKKVFLFLFGLVLFLSMSFNSNASKIDDVTIEPKCTREAAMEIVKIVYHEAGRDDNAYSNSFDAFYNQILTASVIVNNAHLINKDNWYEKIYNVNTFMQPYYCYGGDVKSKNNDTGYCGEIINYRDMDFNSYVPKEKQGKLLYIADLVLSEKFNLPANMFLEAARNIVENNGTVFECVTIPKPKPVDACYGYSALPAFSFTMDMSDVNAFGHKIDNPTAEYYRNLAKSLEKAVDYSKYTPETVCGGLSEEIILPKPGNNPSKPVVDVDVPACENPEILRVIYFASIIVDIIKIIVPLGLVIMAMIDFSKGVTSGNEGDNKKNLSRLIKRFIYAVLIFTVPWIVKIIIINLGNLTKDVNYTDCLENATEEGIEKFQEQYDKLVAEARNSAN